MDAAYPRIRRFALSLFAIVVLGAIVSEYDTVAENVADVAGAALALNLAAMLLSFTISKLARLDDRQATAIALELFTGGAFAWTMSRRSAADIQPLPEIRSQARRSLL